MTTDKSCADAPKHLLPCAFCGCTKCPVRQGNGIGDYWLECTDCGASMRLREDGAGSEKDWNRRPVEQHEAAPASLEGLRRAVLTPRAILRNEDGMLSHPAVPSLDEDVNYETFFAAFGIEAAFIHMENDVDCDTYDQYFASNSANCSFWTPSAPAGDGWLLLEIYDTEDGPVALFVREKMRERMKLEEQETRAEATAAARDVLAERNRQVEQEGHSVEDDDIYNDQGQLSYAAAGLAVLASNAATDIVCSLTGGLTYADECIGSPDPWPHGWQYKPATPRRNLVKAAAMIVAEIERIDRAGGAS